MELPDFQIIVSWFFGSERAEVQINNNRSRCVSACGRINQVWSDGEKDEVHAKRNGANKEMRFSLLSGFTSSRNLPSDPPPPSPAPPPLSSSYSSFFYSDFSSIACSSSSSSLLRSPLFLPWTHPNHLSLVSSPDLLRCSVPLMS